MTAQPNWPAAAQECVGHLQDLIRLNTVNPPGNETLAAEHLAGVLRREGLEPVVLESAPGRGSVVARLKGNGQEPPLLLYGHTDVVGAEPSQWTHPPFGGDLADGFVWGRGALDMKGTVAQQLTVFLALKRQGLPLRRDVIFAATADEEIGGEDSYGVVWLTRHHPDLLRAEYGITEVGGYSATLSGRTIFPIQVAEKGLVWLRVKAAGRPGHASMPHDDNAVVRLSAAIARLGRSGLPYHLTGAADGFLRAAAALGGPEGQAMEGLLRAETAGPILDGALRSHPYRPMLYAMLHNTAAPTGLKAGYQTNVIPGAAEAVVDGRPLPGFDTGAFLDELQAALGPEVTLEVDMEAPALETPHDTPLFKLMSEALGRGEPGALAMPYMMSGATDAKYLARIGVKSYGFSPLRLPPDFPYTDLFHAHDERVPADGLGWGVRVLYEVVEAYSRAA